MRTRWTVLLCILAVAGVALALPYLTIYNPHFKSCDTGMVSEDDFERAHSQGGIRQGSALNPAPTMLIYPNDPYVRMIASTIEGETDIGKADAIAKWISYHIDYEDDTVLYGCKEYWAVPAETLYYMKGDCEDYAILFCSIAKAVGLNVVLFEYPDHISSGLYADNGNLYQCNAMSGTVTVSLKHNNDAPTIYNIGEERYGWLGDYMAETSRWERSIVDVPIYVWDIPSIDIPKIDGIPNPFD